MTLLLLGVMARTETLSLIYVVYKGWGKRHPILGEGVCPKGVQTRNGA